MKTYTIAKDLLPLFKEKLNKFAKKFEKYGSYTINELDSYICEDKNDRRYGYQLIDVEVDASYKVGNYDFVASLEYVSEVKENLIKKVSDDVFVPNEYKYRVECDHCKTNRPRKHTIVLRSKDDGKYIQVGKSCVKDYIGVDLGNYMSYLSFFDNLDDFIEQHMNSSLIRNYKKYYSVDEVLCQTIEEVKRGGYISKSLSIERDCDSTSTRVYLALIEAKNLEGQLIYNKYEVDDNTLKEVTQLKDFYLNNSNDEYKSYLSNNDYIDNIKTILQVSWVSVDKIGLVVSSIGCKLRIENEHNEKVGKPISNYVGSVGDRITIKGVVPTCIYSTQSEYGFMFIYRIIDKDGNEFIWKTSKDLLPDVEVDVVATIKGHNEYRGNKQTEITRAKTSRVF